MNTLKNNKKLHQWLSLFIHSALTISTIGFLALPTWADCVYEGQTYKTGDRVGPYVCMPDGSWQSQ
jgi:hypothetical protein